MTLGIDGLCIFVDQQLQTWEAAQTIRELGAARQVL